MRSVRRRDHSPRLEMMPLIDVIFLLLTFFIYNLIMTVQAEVLPVRFTQESTGQFPDRAEVQWVKLDRQGKLFFGDDAVTAEQLDRRLAALARQPKQPTLYLLVEAEGDRDRAPLLINLFERVKKAGIRNVTFVGQPKRAGPATDDQTGNGGSADKGKQ